jgi:hypothetical protein
MENEGVMALPQAQAAPQMGGLDSLAPFSAAQEVYRSLGPQEFSREALSAGAEVDPKSVSDLLEEVQAAGLTADEIDAIKDLLRQVFEEPGNYAEVRERLIKEGAPEDLLPETFDLEFFTTLQLAIEQVRPALQKFANGGIAELPLMQQLAQEMQNMGRNGDTMLAHITPSEARMLQREGGSGTINPYTGLPEFFLKSIFKGISKAVKGVVNGVKKFAKSTVGRLIITVAAGALLGPAAAGFLGATSTAAVTAISAGVGSFTSGLAAGDGFKRSFTSGITSAALAYGGSALFGGAEAMAPGSSTMPGVDPTKSFGENVGNTFDYYKQKVSNFLTPGSATTATSPTPTAQQLIDTTDYAMAGDVPTGAQVAAPEMSLGTSKYALNQSPLPAQGIGGTAPITPTPTAQAAGAGFTDRLSSFVKDPSLAGFRDTFLVNPNATTTLGKYTPALLTGTAIMGAAGGFKGTPAEENPLFNRAYSGMDYMRDNPELFNQQVAGPLYSDPSIFNVPTTGREGYGARIPRRAPPVYMPPANTLTNMPGGVPQPYNTASLYNIPMIPPGMKKGGDPSKFPRKNGHINGPGTGTSDDIPAMLSDGEFVFTAKAVRNAGGGSRRKGAAKMYKLMKALEKGPVKE